MKSKAKIKWSFNAERDLIRIIEYIAENSVTNARSAFERIKKEARELEKFPERGRIVPELEKQNFVDFRELVVAPWRVIYRVNENVVGVLAVIDSRQNFEDILLRIILNPENFT
jgi:addiction module RelE/StbE family toxin